MGAESSFLVYISNGASMDAAFEALEEASLTVQREEEIIIVTAANGVEFYFGSNDAHSVGLEARELAERFGVPSLAKCRRRFEVMIPDLRASLDEETAVWAVQMRLTDLTKGWTHITWSGALLDPQGVQVKKSN